MLQICSSKARINYAQDKLQKCPLPLQNPQYLLQVINVLKQYFKNKYFTTVHLPTCSVQPEIQDISF